jgi:GH15 family glucan-1,4-alpha-glucosidase
LRIEDYGLIGDVQSAALVGRGGTVDWLCLPRFDSPSCSAALLGDERHGRWRLAPVSDVPATSRRYRPGTLLLDPDFESPEGAVRVIDFMPRRGEGPPRLMRIVERMRGRVPMTMEFSLRPDYGSIVPWVELALDGVVATAGPDAFCLSTPLPLDVQDGTARAEFVAVEGARERLSLGWHPSHESPPPLEDADSGLARTEAWWRVWSERCTYRGRLSRRGAHLADRAQGHDVGDDRRDCRRADDLASGGHRRGAQLGLPILLAPRLGARARRAPRDRLLDVYGEVFGLAFSGVAALGRIDEGRWPRWRTVVEHVETIWRQPDDGIWETRGPRRRFMHSKVMAWVVFDRAVRVAEQYGLDAPLERWKQVRDEIHAEVCERGYDPERRTFTQYYGSKELDASVLNNPPRRLPARDRRARFGNDRRDRTRARSRRVCLPLLDGGNR